HDVWELFRVIIQQRKQRELNPTLTMLRGCVEEVDGEDQTDQITKERIRNMLEFVETTNSWYEEVSDIPTSTLTKLMALGKKITKLVRK
ncbi:MAG: ArsR family transcriptional regulator, partial [Gammaproteobacteria bacterium]|nr:ArsR family transcriptional regulator [Gammaproteobacteria bacterium]